MNKKSRGRGANGAPISVRRVAGGACLVAIVVAAWWWMGESYPETTSAEGLKLIRALYTACSSRNEGRLARVEQAVSELEAKGKLSGAERDAFSSIIRHGQTGNWEKAIDYSYRLAQDQVR